MQLGDVFVLIGIALLIAAAIKSIHNRKKDRRNTSCNGDCSSCNGCH